MLSTASNNRFRTHFKNAASALCARTLPKQRRAEVVATSAARHHTYPRATPPKRAPISCRMCDPVQQPTPVEQPTPQPQHYDITHTHAPKRPNGTVKLKGTLARYLLTFYNHNFIVILRHDLLKHSYIHNLFKMFLYYLNVLLQMRQSRCYHAFNL